MRKFGWTAPRFTQSAVSAPMTNQMLIYQRDAYAYTVQVI